MSPEYDWILEEWSKKQNISLHIVTPCVDNVASIGRQTVSAPITAYHNNNNKKKEYNQMYTLQ